MANQLNMKTNVRIVDIAQMAGVSVGTVDRVIHNRGKVSKENLQKIQEVLSQVDYHPNLIARSLASNRQYVIYVIMPSFREGEYWADVNEGCQRAAAEVAHFNVSVHTFFFDQYDETSFSRLLESLREDEFDGVVIASLFAERVMKFCSEMDSRSIPYVFIDANIKECNNLAYYGISSYNAGRVGARLLLSTLSSDADILMAQMAYNGKNGSIQCQNREKGFQAYLEEMGYHGKIHHVALHSEEAYNFEVLDRIFQEHPNISGAITFNSTCYLLGNYLRQRPELKVRLVGYDIIPRNEEMLREGIVSALIAQRPEAQGFHGVMALEEFLVSGRRVTKENDMPIDILLKENIQFYKNNNI